MTYSEHMRQAHENLDQALACLEAARDDCQKNNANLTVEAVQEMVDSCTELCDKVEDHQDKIPC